MTIGVHKKSEHINQKKRIFINVQAQRHDVIVTNSSVTSDLTILFGVLIASISPLTRVKSRFKAGSREKKDYNPVITRYRNISVPNIRE